MSRDQAHRRGGLYGLLSGPKLYLALQNLVTAKSSRRRFLSEYVQPGPGQRILDVGCGPAEILTLLPANVAYVGLDANPHYIESARQRFGKRATFLCGRAGELSDQELGGLFDRVLLLALLHHLEDLEAEALLGQAARLLAPRGILVTIDPTRAPGQSPIARFLINRDRGARIRSPQQYLELVQPYFLAVTGCVQDGLLRVPYTHFIVRAAATFEAISRE